MIIHPCVKMIVTPVSNDTPPLCQNDIHLCVKIIITEGAFMGKRRGKCALRVFSGTNGKGAATGDTLLSVGDLVILIINVL